MSAGQGGGARRSRCILVLGTHGSGTSAVAGILHTLGVMMGEKLIGGGPTNPKGHFEDAIFRRLLYRFRKDPTALPEMAVYILRQYTRHTLWGIKEPALNEAILKLASCFAKHEYRVIATRRDRLATARSYLVKWPERTTIEKHLVYQDRIMGNRDRFIEERKPTLLWVDYNELTERPEEVAPKIAEFAFEGFPPPDAARLRKAIEFIDPALNHRREREPQAG